MNAGDWMAVGLMVFLLVLFLVWVFKPIEYRN